MDKLFYIMKGGLGHYMNGVPLPALLTKSRSWQIAILVTGDKEFTVILRRRKRRMCDNRMRNKRRRILRWICLAACLIENRKICKINIWKLWKICILKEIKLWRLFYKWRRSLFPFHPFYPKPCNVKNFHDSILWREENPPGSRNLLHTPTCTNL